MRLLRECSAASPLIALSIAIPFAMITTMTTNTIQQYSDYLFIFAHPDDEVPCCGFMHQLVRSGKRVVVVYATSGDAGVHTSVREQEASESLSAIGIPKQHAFLLRIPESKLLQRLPEALDRLTHIRDQVQPRCIISLDYEGGHEGHDAVSFLASQAARDARLPLYVYPAYYGPRGRRVANKFLPGRKTTEVIKLNDSDVDIKIKVFEAHRGQIGTFLHHQRQNPDYFRLAFEREIFRQISKPIDYRKKPASEVGYEFHRNGFTFSDFLKAVNSTTTPTR